MANHEVYTAEEKDLMLELWRNGGTQQLIADRLKISRNQVAGYLNRLRDKGVDLNPYGKRKKFLSPGAGVPKGYSYSDSNKPIVRYVPSLPKIPPPKS